MVHTNAGKELPFLHQADGLKFPVKALLKCLVELIFTNVLNEEG